MAGRPPRILIAWELGANLGHASKVAEVVAALEGRAEVVVAARHPAAFRQIAPAARAMLLAAPHTPPAPPRRVEDRGLSYPDDLRHTGWAEATTLSALVESWSALLDLVRPDVLAAQAAPTALLAARGRALPTAMYGSGYDAPPRAHPMPRFAFWEPDDGVAAEREAAVTGTANAALARHGRPPLARFADVLETDSYLLATFAEVDHYGPRAQFEPDHPPYLGQLATTDVGAEVHWLGRSGPKVLAYLQPSHWTFAPALAALGRLGPAADVVLAAPGAPADAVARAAPPVRLFPGPVRLDRLLGDCDLGLSHASNGVATVFLAHGVPQIGLPTHIEQVMVARAIARQRAGAGLLGRFGPDEIHDAVTKALAAPKLRANARAAAARLGAMPGAGPGPAVADAILRLAEGVHGT